MMTGRDIEETKAAMKDVEKEYGQSAAKAKSFLKKMGYLTKSGKVSKSYSGSDRKSGAGQE
jgi:hypothetical protein